MTRRESYTFGRFTLDVAERRLSHRDGPIALPPKAFDVLVALVRHAGRLIGKRDLLEMVWPESFVEEGILTVHVSALRKALGDSSRPPRYIETVARSGYRFIAPVAEQSTAARTIPGRWSIAVLPARPLSGGVDGEQLIGLALPHAPADSPDGSGQSADRPADGATRVEVYELCGRGRSHLLSASMAEVSKAVDVFRAAVDLDPTYEPAHAGLALAYCAQAAMRGAPPLEAYRDARAAALRALAVGGGSADAQLALGTVLFLAEWDWPASERCLQRAIAIDPHHVQAHLVYGRLLDALGRPDDALDMKVRAFERDPFSPLVHVQIAQCCWNQRRYDDAIAWANKALALDPQHLLAREFLAGAYLFKGEFDRYIAALIAHATVYGVSREHVEPLETAYARGGRQGFWSFSLEQMAQNPTVPACQFAVFLAQTGDTDAAFHHLDRAIADRDPSLVDLAVAPQWDSLRGDPRFDACLSRMGLPRSDVASPLR